VKHLLVITYYWPPSGGAGVQRWLKFTKYLKEFGWRCSVVTVDPTKASYPIQDDSLLDDVSDDIKVYRTKTFEPFTAYKRLMGKKEVPFAGFANEDRPGIVEQSMRFVRGNFFIPDARVGWNEYAFKQAKEIIELDQVDAIATSSPPHSTQLVGLKLKDKFNLPWLADLRDPWTDIYYYSKMNHMGWAKKKDLGLEKKVLHAADSMLMVSQDMQRLFLQKTNNERKEFMHIVPNGYDQSDFESHQIEASDKTTITYTGTLSEIYPLQTFFAVVAEEVGGLNLKFVGKMAPTYVEETKKLKLHDRIDFVDHVPHAESISHLLSSDMLLLCIPEVEDNKGILTGKMFEYLASGKFIICLGPEDGDAANIIRECKAGVTVDPHNKEGIKEALQLAVEKAQQGNLHGAPKELIERYSRKSLTEQVVNILNGIC